MPEWNKESFNREVHDAAERAESEVRKLIDYLNNEVVPDVRRHGSSALRTAADRLHAMAEHLEDTKGSGEPPR